MFPGFHFQKHDLAAAAWADMNVSISNFFFFTIRLEFENEDELSLLPLNSAYY
jgi:hypothetical protein